MLAIAGASVVVAATFAALRIVYGMVAITRLRQNRDFSQIVRKINKIS